jgi:hypothetical protein
MYTYTVDMFLCSCACLCVGPPLKTFDHFMGSYKILFMNIVTLEATMMAVQVLRDGETSRSYNCEKLSGNKYVKMKLC